MELSPAFAAGPELVVPAECMRSLTELFVLQRDELRVVQRSGPVRLAATLTQLGPQPKPELQLYSLALVLDPSPSPHTLTCLANPTLDLTTAWREHREPQGTPSNSNPDPSPNSNPNPSPSPHPNLNPDPGPSPHKALTAAVLASYMDELHERLPNPSDVAAPRIVDIGAGLGMYHIYVDRRYLRRSVRVRVGVRVRVRACTTSIRRLRRYGGRA